MSPRLDQIPPAPKGMLPRAKANAKKAGLGLIQGWFLRRTINRVLGGKDWYESFTAWGLIIWTATEAGAVQICGQGLLPQADCDLIQFWIVKAGQALTILGVRRGGK